MFLVCQLSKFLLYWVPINVFVVVVFFLFYDASWSGDDDPREDIAKSDYKWSQDDDPQEDLAKFEL
jgi:hypothetical protein